MESDASENMLKKYITPEDKLHFYVEGIHCAGCIHRIEALTSQSELNLVNLNVNMAEGIVTVELSNTDHPEKIMQAIQNLGYKVKPIKHKETTDLKIKENRTYLIKIAVAFVVTGNIMLLSVSTYSGASSDWTHYFDVISSFLFLPVLFFSAQPFYKEVFICLKTKSISIDIPIVLALLFGYLLSLYNTYVVQGHVYYDSISMLVLLLLASRYFLIRVQQKYNSISYNLPFLQLTKVRKKCCCSGKITNESLDQIKKGNTLVLEENETFPLDGTLTQNSIYINNALLTGESLPQKVLKGEMVYAGAKLLSSTAEFKVTHVQKETRIEKIMEKVTDELAHKAPIVLLTDKAAKFFTFAIILLGIFSFAIISYLYGTSEGINRSLALIVLACPCALALATPFAQSLSLLTAFQKGFIIRKAELFERLTKTKGIIFDKTGTLTTGHFQILKWYPHKPSDKDLNLIYSLEQNSKHPIGLSICHFLKDNCQEVKLNHIKETLGTGVMAQSDNETYEIKRADLSRFDSAEIIQGCTYVGYYKNSIQKFIIALGDQIKPEVKETISFFNEQRLIPIMLSGDVKQCVQYVASQLGFKSENVFSDQSPEQKLSFAKEHQKHIMVGDGANDAAALAASYVGIAVKGSLEVSLNASSVYLNDISLNKITDLYRLAQETLFVIKRNLLFSFLYNIIGIVLALFGYINPLVAAILMPISSVIVILSSLYGTSWLRNYKNANKNKLNFSKTKSFSMNQMNKGVSY